eukprot:g17139.t1
MDRTREPRVPLPPGHVWPNIPILKHRSMIAEPVTQAVSLHDMFNARLDFGFRSPPHRWRVWLWIWAAQGQAAWARRPARCL